MKPLVNFHITKSKKNIVEMKMGYNEYNVTY